MNVAQQISLAPIPAMEPPAPAPRAANAVVKSAGRALQILELFDTVRREACVSEISRALHYPQSSTSVLLRSLVSLGYLQYDRYKRTFYPTRRVSLLGSWVDQALVQRGSLLTLVDWLSEKSGLTAALATPNGLNAQYIHFSRPSGAGDSDVSSIGTLRPIAQTAVGRALLSTNDDIYVGKLLRRVNAEREEGEEAIDVRRFLDMLRTGRRRGYFTGAGAAPGEAGIAAVLDRDRQILVVALEGEAGDIEARQDIYASILESGLEAPMDATGEF